MRKRTALVLALVALLAAFAFAGDKPWFDMENCSFCKHLSKDPNLMKNMTWEQYQLDNGLLVLTTVKPESKAAYEEAMKAMQKLGEEMMAGTATDVKLCGHCDYYGMLMQSGAKFQHVSTPVGDIDLITTDKPDVLKLIREYELRNKEAMAKMEAETVPK